MRIKEHKQFLKSFKKLTRKQQLRVIEVFNCFKDNPFDKALYNHALHGKWAGYRSLSAGGDLRIIFKEKDNYIEVLVIDVGSHSQLY